MTVRDFLRAPGLVDLSALAQKMWPANADAISYLKKKLKDGPTGRPWTVKDEALAFAALQKLAVDISSLTLDAPTKEP